MDDHRLARGELFDLELLRRAERYQRWVLGALGPFSGTVVEVGAGTGNFTRWLSTFAERVVAVEPEAGLADQITALGLPNVEVVRSRVETLAEALPAFDHAVSINVLEHIEDDEAAARAILSLVKPGGRISILVPAHRALYGDLDRRYHHLRRYSKAGLGNLLRRAGADLETVRYFNPIGGAGWLLFVRWLKRTRLTEATVELSERVAVPLGRTLERVGFHPFGQSVIAAGRRPGL